MKNEGMKKNEDHFLGRASSSCEGSEMDSECRI